MVDKTKFLDGSGKRVILGLFKEFSRVDVKFKPIYTLAQWKDVFLDCRDPSEYAVAMHLLGDWDHWLEIRNHPIIKEHVDKWHKELEVKLRSEAIQQMKHHAKQVGGTAAAKWLADKGYTDGISKRGIGRPKEEKEVPIKNIGRIAGDMARLGIVVGGKH
tara:strand:- start:84 stop:563 length:480 start_codon:yes stop_codon:yes gene_type:complete